MTKTKTQRSWRRAGRCLGLILGLLWLTGCAGDYYRFERMPGAVQTAAMEQDKARCSLYIREQLRQPMGVSTALIAGMTAPSDYEDCMRMAGWVDAAHPSH